MENETRTIAGTRAHDRWQTRLKERRRLNLLHLKRDAAGNLQGPRRAVSLLTKGPGHAVGHIVEWLLKQGIEYESLMEGESEQAGHHRVVIASRDPRIVRLRTLLAQVDGVVAVDVPEGDPVPMALARTRSTRFQLAGSAAQAIDLMAPADMISRLRVFGVV